MRPALKWIAVVLALLAGNAAGLSAQTDVAPDSAQSPNPPIAQSPNPPIAESPNPPIAQSPIRPIAQSPKPYRNKLIALPYVSYTPQTRVLFGVGGRYQFKSAAARVDSITRSSAITGNILYTTKGQWGVSFGTSLYLPRNRWWIAGGVSAGFFPFTYYRVGQNTREIDNTQLEQHFQGVDARVLRQVAGNFSTGLHYRGARFTGVKFDDPSLAPAGLSGRSGGTLSGLGIVAQVEARNSTTTPTRGHYLLVDLLRYGGWVGSDFGYSSLAVDARYYLPLRGGKDVLALAAFGQWNGTDVPLQGMSLLGGITTQELMRGVYLGRFRDRHQVVAQADYRAHLKGRFGYVVYGSAGNVYGSGGSSLWDHLKFTYGAGLRFNLNPSDPLNVRMDYTLTSFGSKGLSLGAAEAF